MKAREIALGDEGYFAFHFQVTGGNPHFCFPGRRAPDRLLEQRARAAEELQHQLGELEQVRKEVEELDSDSFSSISRWYSLV